jgi:hypothetical protein
MGALPCLVGATLVAAAVVIWAERRRNRRLGLQRAGANASAPAPSRPMSPLTAAGLTLLGVLLVVYVIFVAANSG